MNLYRISQSQNRGYDTYDSAIVAARSPSAAREINPEKEWGSSRTSWCATPEQVTVEYIGIAAGTTSGVILSSFNAG